MPAAALDSAALALVLQNVELVGIRTFAIAVGQVLGSVVLAEILILGSALVLSAYIVYQIATHIDEIMEKAKGIRGNRGVAVPVPVSVDTSTRDKAIVKSATETATQENDKKPCRKTGSCEEEAIRIAEHVFPGLKFTPEGPAR